MSKNEKKNTSKRKGKIVFEFFSICFPLPPEMVLYWKSSQIRFRWYITHAVLENLELWSLISKLIYSFDFWLGIWRWRPFCGEFISPPSKISGKIVRKWTLTFYESFFIEDFSPLSWKIHSFKKSCCLFTFYFVNRLL